MKVRELTSPIARIREPRKPHVRGAEIGPGVADPPTRAGVHGIVRKSLANQSRSTTAVDLAPFCGPALREDEDCSLTDQIALDPTAPVY